jgi:hypothetical protein
MATPFFRISFLLPLLSMAGIVARGREARRRERRISTLTRLIPWPAGMLQKKVYSDREVLIFSNYNLLLYWVEGQR